VLHFKDGVEIVVELDHHTRAQLCCWDHKREFLVYQNACVS
jgi:hypothetical protein